jgi:hypothetical protein
VSTGYYVVTLFSHTMLLRILVKRAPVFVGMLTAASALTTAPGIAVS